MACSVAEVELRSSGATLHPRAIGSVRAWLAVHVTRPESCREISIVNHDCPSPRPPSKSCLDHISLQPRTCPIFSLFVTLAFAVPAALLRIPMHHPLLSAFS